MTLRLLHLEDDDLDAELAAETLRADGFAPEITRVQTRDEFVSQLRAIAFQIILADFQLPSFDGLTAQSLAAEIQPDTPFIFVSGTLGEEIAVERLKAGATDYVLKQRMARLPAAVRRALAERAEQDQRRRA